MLFLNQTADGLINAEVVLQKTNDIICYTRTTKHLLGSYTSEKEACTIFKDIINSIKHNENIYIMP